MSLPVAIGSVVNDRYVVERVLGEGGMGVVVLARHRVLDQRVAIKFLRRGPTVDQSAVARFVAEARAAAKITSEYVARVHDVAVLADDTPYIVMEYLEGATLAVLLGSGPLPVRDALRFALQTCEVLAETHAVGIIHGDLKPENIYIAGAGAGEARRVKLLDFGVSKIALEAPAAAAVVMGTPAYMAPEQLDHGAATRQTDLFALGAVLYEMLTGQVAFGTGSVDEIRGRMQRGPAPMGRPDVPPALEEIVRRCLAVDPARRFTDAFAIAAYLEPFAPVESSAQRIGNRTGPVVPRAGAIPRRHAETVLVGNRSRGHGAWIAAVVAALGITGLVLILIVLRARSTLHPTTAATPPMASSVAVEAAAAAPPPEVPPAASIAAKVEPPPPAAAPPSVAAVESARPKSRPPRPRPAAPVSTPTSTADRFGTRK